jgi:nucleotide-binding universal stress UspA family protein
MRNKRLKILIAYDGSSCADAALADLTRARLPREAEAVVMTVAEQWLIPPRSYGMVETTFSKSASRTVAKAMSLARQAGERISSLFPSWKVQAEAASGSPARLVIEKADDWPADLIVVGSHGCSALSRSLLGSVSNKVVTEARCSVRVARGRTVLPGTPLRILVGVDGSPGSEAAVRAVSARMWPAGSEARVVAVLDEIAAPVSGRLDWNDEDGRTWVSETLDTAARELRAKKLIVSSLTRNGDPRRILPREAKEWGADCIFVGAKELSCLDRFLLGSVSAAVAARARCSVEVVRDRNVSNRQSEVAFL